MSLSAIALLMKILRADAGIISVINDRLYAEIAPQADANTPAMPHAVLRLAGGSREYGLDGASGVREARVTILGFAPSFEAAERIADAVEDACTAFYRGTVDGTDVTIFSEGVEVSDFVPDVRLFRRAKEVRVVISA